MTETTTSAPKGNMKRNLVITLVVLTVVVALAVFIIARSGFDKAIVKQKLDESIVTLHEYFEARGRDVQVTYGELDVVGGLTSRHVVVHNVSVTVKPSEPQPLKPGQTVRPDSLTVTTPEVLVHPTAMDLSSLRLSFTQPLNFAATDAPEKSLLKVAADAPIDIAIARSTKNKVPYVKVDHTAPGFVDFTYLREQQAQGAEDTAPTVVPVYDTLHVVFTPGSSLHADVATDGSNLGMFDMDYKQITMAPQSAPEAVLTIAGIQEKWSSTLDAHAIKRVSLVANVGPLTGPADVLPYAPIALEVDAAYVAVPPAPVTVTAPAADAVPAEPSTIDIKKFSLTVKDASLLATADFESTPGDILPSGKAELVLVNVPFIRDSLQKNGILKPESEGWVNAILTQITGAPVEQLKDVTIPISREKGGQFKVGHSTFEELVGIVIREMMQKSGAKAPAAGPVPVPALPPADKPKHAPISVPDHGVRG